MHTLYDTIIITFIRWIIKVHLHLRRKKQFLCTNIYDDYLFGRINIGNDVIVAYSTFVFGPKQQLSRDRTPWSRIKCTQVLKSFMFKFSGKGNICVVESRKRICICRVALAENILSESTE